MTRLAEFYDAVLVHGDPALAPLDLSWPVDERLRPLLRYTGYVDEGTPTADRRAARRDRRLGRIERRVAPALPGGARGGADRQQNGPGAFSSGAGSTTTTSQRSGTTPRRM